MPGTYLAVGDRLTVTAGSASSGTLVRLANQPGGGSPISSTAIAAGTSLTVGPFADVTRWDVVTAAGPDMTYSTAKYMQDLSGVGAPAGTVVSVSESGNEAVHRTVLTLASLSITMTDATTAGSHGTQKVYDFPAGAIQILGCSFDLTTLAGTGGITDTAALVGSLGTVALATDNATLTGTEADLIASTAGTLSAGAGTLKKHGSLVAVAFDGTTTPIDAILNIAIPDAGSTANDTVAVSGTITITWLNIGDY